MRADALEILVSECRPGQLFAPDILDSLDALLTLLLLLLFSGERLMCLGGSIQISAFKNLNVKMLLKLLATRTKVGKAQLAFLGLSLPCLDLNVLLNNFGV